jgi:ligand-binding SRPBCC domain-containing protein
MRGGSMQQNQVRNSVMIEAPISKVYSYLTEYKNMIHLHPLIEEIRELPSKNSHKSTLEIKDKIPLFGVFPIYKTYKAMVESNPSDFSITMETYTFPQIHIKNELKLQSNEEHTIVLEDKLVETPSSLAKFVMKQVVFSHSNMLTKLKKIMEVQKQSV